MDGRHCGHLAGHRCVTFQTGDVRAFTFPQGTFDYVVHFGSTGSKKFHDEQPEAFFDLIVAGTRRVLEFAAQAGASRFLLASTGAIYGRAEVPGGVSEELPGGPDPLSPASANAEAKRVAEFLACCLARRRPELTVSIARGFAFVGPYLPKDAGFAAYEFIQDSLHGRDIRVIGDGTPLRSYLYGADLAVWLWTILLRSPSGQANLGEPLSRHSFHS